MVRCSIEHELRPVTDRLNDLAECRNNLAPIYKPRGADIWSLGIVLINM